MDVAEQRIHEIDPNIKVTTYKTLYPETQDQFDFTQYDYVVMPSTQSPARSRWWSRLRGGGTPIICAMGAGQQDGPHPL